MKISRANSITFYNTTDDRYYFEGRPDVTTDYIKPQCFVQKFCKYERVYFQIINDSQPSVSFVPIQGMSEQLSPSGTFTENGVTYYEYNKQIIGNGYFKVTDGQETWRSYNIIVFQNTPKVRAKECVFKIEWTNYETAFKFYYGARTVNFSHYAGYMRNYQPAIQQSVYNNQNQIVKLKEVIYRTVEFVLEAVSRLEAEKIIIATAHDLFVINDTVYVIDEKPNIKNLDRSELYEVTIRAKEVNRIGANKHDEGYVLDNESDIDPAQCTDDSNDTQSK